MIYTPETTPDVRVFVDGIQRYDCFYADDEQGIVRGYKQQGNDDNTDPNGHVELRDVPGKQESELVVVEYHGRVEVVNDEGERKAPWE